MNEFITVSQTVLPVFGIMLIGLLLRQRNWFTAEADASLMRVTVNLLLPALIFDSVVSNAALRQPENIFLPPLLGFGMVAVGILFARPFAKLAGLNTKPEQRTFAFLTGLQNYAYLVIPLCISLFDADTVGVLFVHNVGTEIAMWSLGVMTLSGGITGGWRRFLNAPLIALLLALGFNFLGAAVQPPTAIVGMGTTLLTLIHWLGQSAVPLALLLIGAIVADHLPELRGGNWLRVVGVASVVRIGLLPFVFILAAKFLPCSMELKRVLILQGAMPSAVLPIVISKHYGGDARIALQVALGTSILGVITIPLWIHFGGRLAGLW